MSKLQLIKDMGLSTEDVISKAKTALIRVSPFWGILVSSCVVKTSDKNDTAWTDGFEIWFNPDFLGKLTLPELNFILAHEVWHIANLHLPRLGAKHPRVWNIATDHWINLTLHDEAQRLPRTFAVPDFARIFGKGSSIILDQNMRDKVPDEIYAKIMREESKKQQKKSKAGSGTGSGNLGDGVQDPNGQLGNDLDYKAFEERGGTQADKAKELEKQWKGNIASAADAAKKAGKLPLGMERYIDELLQPKVDYKSLLAAYLSSTLADYEFTNPDRRFSDWDFVVPDMVGEQLECAVVIDTSGSMSSEQIAQIISETHSIIRSFDAVKGTLIGHDHAVHDWIEFSSTEPPPMKIKGGGGTDFHCVIAEMDKRKYKPNVCIWFTDLYADMIKPTDFPMIFVAVNTDLRPPDWSTGVSIEL